MGFLGGSDGKESACNTRDKFDPRRSPGEGNGYPLQYFCLENSVDRGVWWTTVHGVTELDMTELTCALHSLFMCVCLHVYIYSYSILSPYRLLQNVEYSSLCYTVDPCWLSILYTIVCLHGEGNGKPLQHSCLENPMDRGKRVVGYSPLGWKELDMTLRLNSKQCEYVNLRLPPPFPFGNPKFAFYVCGPILFCYRLICMYIF